MFPNATKGTPSADPSEAIGVVTKLKPLRTLWSGPEAPSLNQRVSNSRQATSRTAGKRQSKPALLLFIPGKSIRGFLR